MNDQDAKSYGTALANALRHLPVRMAQKYVDFATLGVAIVAYEGPRVAEDYRLRQLRLAGQQPQRPPLSGQGGQVFQFRPPPGGQGNAAGGPPPAAAAHPPAVQPAAGPVATFAGPPADMTYEPDVLA